MVSVLPYIYFGGKRSIASVVWQKFGNVKTYVEPFFGGGAVFWLRPPEHFGSGEKRWELLNDIDGMVVNFLRAVYHDPHAVAHFSDWHITEVDLTARHIWLVNQKEGLVQRLEADPEYYDPKIAGWWVWGINNWIGRGWCSGRGSWTVVDGKMQKASGICMGGVHKQRPQIGCHTKGMLGASADLVAYLGELSGRLRGYTCKIICGDWKRCVTPCCTVHSGVPVGVFLDPPYGEDRNSELYNHDSTQVHKEVLQWCIDNGNNPNFRIALCGYTGYYEELEKLDWQPFYWKANGGYANAGKQKTNDNNNREVVWFSPHCLNQNQNNFFVKQGTLEFAFEES